MRGCSVEARFRSLVIAVPFGLGFRVQGLGVKELRRARHKQTLQPYTHSRATYILCK